MLLTVMLISSTMFSGTYAWFWKTLDGNDDTGQMGYVHVELEEDDGEYSIVNTSAIPIILRVRVIAEWVNGTAGVPPSDIGTGIGNLEISDDDWALRTGEDGLFLVYMGGDGFEDFIDNTITTITDDYTILQPAEDPIPLPEINIDGERNGWNLEITLIAEALQATRKAYEYTIALENAINPGVTSWALDTVEGGGG